MSGVFPSTEARKKNTEENRPGVLFRDDKYQRVAQHCGCRETYQLLPDAINRIF